MGDVGIIAFNFFLLEPVLGEVQKAIDGFRQRGAKAGQEAFCLHAAEQSAANLRHVGTPTVTGPSV